MLQQEIPLHSALHRSTPALLAECENRIDLNPNIDEEQKKILKDSLSNMYFALLHPIGIITADNISIFRSRLNNLLIEIEKAIRGNRQTKTNERHLADTDCVRRLRKYFFDLYEDSVHKCQQ